MTVAKTSPGAVLFVCNLNAVRSPMAEALTKSLYSNRLYVDSAGLEPSERDFFAIAVMAEIGIDMAQDQPISLEEIDISAFDNVICLTDEAYRRVLELANGNAVNVEFWPTLDLFASNEPGTREQRMAAYRQLREDLRRMIEQRFGAQEKAAG